MRRNTLLMLIISFFAVCLLVSCGSSSSSTAVDTGSGITLSGVVVNTEEATVPDATVTLMDGVTGQSLGVSDVSAADGTYSLTLPAAGDIYLNMTAEGYVPTNTEVSNVTVSITDAEVLILHEEAANDLVYAASEGGGHLV